MTREEFLRREAAAARAFMDRFVMKDFLSPELPQYHLRYVCEDGFVTHDARALWDHCHGGLRQGNLFSFEIMPRRALAS